MHKISKTKKLPLQVGDIIKTHSNINKLKKYSGYKPKTNIKIVDLLEKCPDTSVVQKYIIDKKA